MQAQEKTDAFARDTANASVFNNSNDRLQNRREVAWLGLPLPKILLNYPPPAAQVDSVIWDVASAVCAGRPSKKRWPPPEYPVRKIDI